MAEAVLPAREPLLRRALWLEALTITWNVLEAAIALVAGFLAGSIALVGFGLDSIIETIAAVALYRRLSAELRGASLEDVVAHEKRALRIVGITFLVLSAYILFESGMTLWQQDAPAPSGVGIVLAGVSLVVMPVLALGKLWTSRALDSGALIADSKETFVCSYLSLCLLIGLGANAIFGWWWADPAAALLMLPWVVKEGFEALEGDSCE